MNEVKLAGFRWRYKKGDETYTWFFDSLNPMSQRNKSFQEYEGLHRSEKMCCIMFDISYCFRWHLCEAERSHGCFLVYRSDSGFGKTKSRRCLNMDTFVVFLGFGVSSSTSVNCIIYIPWLSSCSSLVWNCYRNIKAPEKPGKVFQGNTFGKKKEPDWELDHFIHKTENNTENVRKLANDCGIQLCERREIQNYCSGKTRSSQA